VLLRSSSTPWRIPWPTRALRCIGTEVHFGQLQKPHHLGAHFSCLAAYSSFLCVAPFRWQANGWAHELQPNYQLQRTVLRRGPRLAAADAAWSAAEQER
jgi:hypothetical protein